MDSPDTTPIPIPSEDNAWQDMRDRLDKEMPLTDAAPAVVRRNSFPGKMLWTLSTVLLVALAILLLRKAPTQSLVSGGKSAGSDTAAPLTVEKSANAAPSTAHKFAAVATPKKYPRPHTRAQPLLSGRRTSNNDERDARQSSERSATIHERDARQSSERTATIHEHDARQSSERAFATHGPDVVDRSSNQEIKTIPAPLSTSQQLDNTPLELPRGEASGSGIKHLMSTMHIQLPDTLFMTFGLQWTEEYPFGFGSNGNYFMGTQGRPRYYRALLPSAWMQLQLDRSILGIEINPFYSQNVGKGLESQSSSVVVGDTTIGTSSSRLAVKVFGLSTSIDYLGSIGGHWWAGAGLRLDWWVRAVASDWTIVQKQTTSGFESINETLEYGPISKNDWRDVPTFQLDLLGEILYKRGISQAGFRLGVSPDAGQRNFNSGFFFQLEFFYRLSLFSKKVYLRDDEK
jgi:hypothetical protein